MIFPHSLSYGPASTDGPHFLDHTLGNTLMFKEASSQMTELDLVSGGEDRERMRHSTSVGSIFYVGRQAEGP